MDYTPPPGDAIALDLGPEYTPPPGDAIVFDIGTADGEVELRPVKPAGTSFFGGKLKRLDKGIDTWWSAKKPYDRAARVPVVDLDKEVEPTIRLPWAATYPVHPEPTRAGWQLLDKQQRLLHIPWINLDPCSSTCRLPWGDTENTDRLVRIPWIAGDMALDFTCEFPWGSLNPHHPEIIVPWWADKPNKDLVHRSFWGRELYDRICRRAYEPPPGDAIILDIDELLSHVGDGDHVDFFFDELSYDLRCTQREPSGWRDNYFYQPPKNWPKAPKLEAWIVINTALLTRVLDGKPVEVHRMELSADIDSWCWSFTARVPAASLELVMPLDAPVAVDAIINGYAWRVLIESWSESHSFARREYTIRGRGLSAYLTEPYAPARAGSNESAANARQLAEAQLEHTGWELQWGLVDWLVPIGALSYSNATPLKVIQQIAEAAGGRIISHRTDKQLIALPRLHSLPWSWPAATPALGINDYVVKTLSREFVPNVSYDAVFVSGENQGVLCKVYRAGTAGAVLAPMVTDALITDVEPARARGKLVIGQSGKWSRESLELPLTSAGVLPGLLEIGSLVSMEERGTIWRGQVVGVKIGADFGSAFTVRQSVDVERYRGR